ncbi:MAG: hypothetical protein BWY44_01411 [Candidatus Omnitrophica bacterium ADurb.Bin292]|nr:MAG: hypothetical protein BWY44_01411 [Candidatus Omnitrophica bacterium ADurb.Bin292]
MPIAAEFLLPLVLVHLFLALFICPGHYSLLLSRITGHGTWVTTDPNPISNDPLGDTFIQRIFNNSRGSRLFKLRDQFTNDRIVDDRLHTKPVLIRQI